LQHLGTGNDGVEGGKGSRHFAAEELAVIRVVRC
jgi:hypothetical protein